MPVIYHASGGVQSLTWSPTGHQFAFVSDDTTLKIRDRAIHFAYGLLLAYPIREIFLRVANVRGFWGYFLPLDLTMSTSMMFELFEWGAAELFGGDLGMAYLGTQGDVWDAHKDMALASTGAFIAMLATVLINAWLQADFAREWTDSLRIKSREPLGETAIMRMLKGKRKQGTDEQETSKRI